MRAIHMTAPGGPEVLHAVTVDAPVISSPTQIKVRIRAAGINPVDAKVRSRALFYGAQPPAIIGCDLAGEVVAIGNAVTRFQIGDAIWACHGGLGREPGNYAEYTVLEQDRAEHKPTTTDFAHAAAGPLVLITAWEALFDQAGLQAGQSVLIHAAAGGVGHVAVQLAKIRGARVLATVGNDANADFVRGLGADEVVNYHSDDLAAAVADFTGGNGVDVCLDTVGPSTFRTSIPLIAHYGCLVTLLDPGSDLALGEARMRNLRIAFTLMLTPMLCDLADALAHHGEILRQCAQWIDAGQLKIHVSQRYPLEQAAAAHAAIETGHTRGKLVLET